MGRPDPMPDADPALQVLLVERDGQDASSIQRALTAHGFAYTMTRVRTEREFREVLSNRFDIIIAHRHFSARDRARAAELMRERDIDVPLVFVADHSGARKDALAGEPYLLRALGDIAARKDEERRQRTARTRLARARRAQQVLLECNRAFAYETREAELLDRTCRILVDAGGYVRASIGLVDSGVEGAIAIAVSAGREEAGEAQRPLCDGAREHAMASVIATGRPHLARDLPSSPGETDGRGCQSALTLPLLVDGECAGGIGVYARDPDAFGDDEAALLAMLAKDLAYGMGALRKEAARQRAESQLARVLRARRVMAECNHALIHASDEPTLLREICRIMVESGGYVQAWIGFGTGNPKRPVRVGAHAGFGADEPMSSAVSWDQEGRYRGPMGRVIASAQPDLARDILNTQADNGRRERARRLGYQSTFIVPLAGEEGTIGAIDIHAREPDAFDDEEIALVTELARDFAYGITALRMRVGREYAERRLRASERRYRETFNQAAVGITRIDLNGVITEVNQKFCDMLGYSPAELVGRSVRSITHPDDAGRGARMRMRAPRGDARPWVNEKRFIAKDGRIVWGRRTMSVAQDDDGRPQYVISVVEDITAGKALEQRFEATFNQAAVGLMHSSLDRRVLLVNQRLCEMLGYGADELADIAEQQLHHPIDANADDALESRLVAGDIRTFSLEKRYIRKDGRVIWCRRTVSLARDAEGSPQYFIRVFEDITDRKEAEERYRTTVQQAPVGIVHTAVDGRILQVNPRFGEIVGHPEQALLGMNHREIVHPADHGSEHDRDMQRLLHGKIPSYTSDKRLVHKTGAAIWARHTVSVVRDSARAPLYLIRIVEDITREKETEERYRATVEHAPVGIMHTDHARRILHVNRKLCAMLGYTAEQLLGRTSTSLLREEDRGRHRGRFEDLWAGRSESFAREQPLLRSDAKIVWMRNVVSLVRDTGGEPRYFVHLMEDITGTREAEERYRATFDCAPVGILHASIHDDRILRVNRKLCDILGYSEADLLALRTTDLLHPSTRRTDRPRYFEQMLAGEMSSYSSERLFVRKDGSHVWTNRTVSVVRDASGKPLYFIRIIEDISERKRAQQALEHTSRLNALLQALAVAANEAQTPEQAFRACLAQLSAFSGWVLGRVVIFAGQDGDCGQQLSIWHGMDARWEPFRRDSGALTPEPKPGLVNRILSAGQTLWLEQLPDDPAEFRRAEAARACGLRSVFAFPVMAAGRSYALIELYSDRCVPRDAALVEAVPQIGAQLARVAERRFAEHALLESERFARATMDALSQHICVVGEAGVIMAVNKAWRQFAAQNGYSPATVWEGENFFHVSDKATGMSAAEVANVASGMRDVLTGLQDEFTTEYTTRVNAEQRWFAVKATRFPGAGPRRAVVSYEDITDRALSQRRRGMEHAVTSVLAESISLTEAMPRLIRTMCEAMDWAYGALWRWGEGDEPLRRAEYWSDAPLALEPEDRRYWQEVETGPMGGLLRRVLREREATWIVDVQDDPSFKRRPSAQKLGLVSAYAFPIIAVNKVIGMMEFFGREARQPDEMMIQVTRSIGSQIGQYIQRREAEQALRMSEERFRITISQASVGITVTSLDLRYVMVNDKSCEILGYAREELLGLTLKDVLQPAEREQAMQMRQRVLQGEATAFDREKQLVRKDGSLVWVAQSTSLVRGERNEPKHFISVIQDISDRKRAEIALRESEEKFVQLASNIPQVFWIGDAAMKQAIYVSPACAQLLGVAADEIRRDPTRLVRAVHPGDRKRVRRARKAASAGAYDEIFRIVRPDGTVRWVHDRAFPIREGANPVSRIAGIAEDITHRREAEEKLLYLAHYDTLTGLPNRNMFYDRLTQAMAHARRRNRLAAVLFLDLDRFKITNDTLGHSAGDALLIQVARRLGERVRAGDTVGRFGGDEFGLILSDLRSVDDARATARKIMGAFEAPFALERSEVYVSGSIGISMYPADSDEEGALMKNADAAMYRAKEAGRNNFQFYTAEMNARALHRLDMENNLRRALERGEFLLHYQPKVELASGRITGVEALLRWNRPGGMVPPAEFVPLLEDSGLIMSVGEWLLEEACAQAKAWEQAGVAPVPVAINVSARQFARRDLGRAIERVIKRYRIAPDMLQLELTESSLMSNTADAVDMLRDLKSLGVQLSIDDFGTGYSSLAYLQCFPIDALKVDRSFVSEIHSDRDDATIIRAVIGMAHSLGVKVVAEGVETRAQLAFLLANGCDEMQGFYYSAPLPGDECRALLLDPPPLQLDRERGGGAD